MKLKFTRKTWYFFLLAAAAVSMLGGFAVLSGMDFSASQYCFWRRRRGHRPRTSAITRWCSCC